MQRIGMAEYHSDVPAPWCKPYTPFEDDVSCWKGHLLVHTLAPYHMDTAFTLYGQGLTGMMTQP